MLIVYQCIKDLIIFYIFFSKKLFNMLHHFLKAMCGGENSDLAQNHNFTTKCVYLIIS